MTQLEIEISTNKRLIANKKQEIEKGVDDFKKRLRAMYLAGDESYTSVILNSNDFYDILMRMELVKRVASHDNQMIDDLIAKKEEYEKAQKELEDKQSEYDSQYDELNKQKAELDELYDSSKKAKRNFRIRRKNLRSKIRITLRNVGSLRPIFLEYSNQAMVIRPMILCVKQQN